MCYLSLGEKIVTVEIRRLQINKPFDVIDILFILLSFFNLTFDFAYEKYYKYISVSIVLSFAFFQNQVEAKLV